MKQSKLILVAAVVLISAIAYAQGDSVVNNNTIIREGVGLGSVIAVVASWSRNKSILWAILHGIFSWLYVIYFALTRTERTYYRINNRILIEL